MFPMDALYFVRQQTAWISDHFTEISPSLGDFPIFGGLSHHPTGQCLPLATPVFHTSSSTCSQWIRYTLFDRKYMRTGVILCISFPPLAISHLWELSHQPMGQHLVLRTPVLNRSSRTCSQCIRRTWFDQNPSGESSLQ